MPEYPFYGSGNENVWNLSLRNAPIVELFEERLLSKGVRLFLKREDQIHPEVSGNKWRKLKYNLLKAKEQNKDCLLTFGGAFSNHIAALAAAAKAMDMESIGIIRGEEVLPLNPTLSKASVDGMRFQFVSRTEYREKKKLSFIEMLKARYGDFYHVPEGGSNCLALKGVGELMDDVLNDDKLKPNYVCTAMGTGGTMAGLVARDDEGVKIIGFPALKGNFLELEVKQFLNQCGYEINEGNWGVNNNYHFGGFAKYNTELIDFINQFKTLHNIPLDPIYTGKMMYGIFDLIEKDYFDRGSQILAIHTGGLQGIAGFNQRYGDLIV